MNVLFRICFGFCLYRLTFCTPSTIGNDPLNPFRPTPRIVGGSEARYSVRKHLAHLLIYFTDLGVATCTGSIYKAQTIPDSSRRWILTAAHCFEIENQNGPSTYLATKHSFVLIAPRSTRLTLEDMDRENAYRIKRVYIPKMFRQADLSSRYDVALVELERDIDKDIYNPVEIGKEPAQGTTVVAAGYGDSRQDGDPPPTVQETQLISQQFSTCARTENTTYILVEGVHVCATSIGFPFEGLTDTCTGDSGGPIFEEVSSNVFKQYGITSFASTDCAALGGTPWYARASAFLKLLDDIIKFGNNRFFFAIEG